MTDDDDGFFLAQFATYEEARQAANGNIMGAACGAIVFDLDEDGEDV